jgi:hypothetical protein
MHHHLCAQLALLKPVFETVAVVILLLNPVLLPPCLPTGVVQVLEAYFEGTMPDNDTIKRLIRKGTINRVFVPMVCGTAFKNKGVQPLLDAVVDYLPSPLEIPDVAGVSVRVTYSASVSMPVFFG